MWCAKAWCRRCPGYPGTAQRYTTPPSQCTNTYTLASVHTPTYWQLVRYRLRLQGCTRRYNTDVEEAHGIPIYIYTYSKKNLPIYCIFIHVSISIFFSQAKTSYKNCSIFFSVHDHKNIIMKNSHKQSKSQKKNLIFYQSETRS